MSYTDEKDAVGKEEMKSVQNENGNENENESIDITASRVGMRIDDNDNG